MKEELEHIIDQNREELLELGRDLFEHPELGFKEFRTRDQVIAFLQRHGMTVESDLSVTGFRCTIGTGDGPNIGIIGELDAIPTPGHRCASEDQGAAHACAHSNQMVITLAAMMALHKSRVLEGSRVKVTLIATPAEEFTDFAYRHQLIEEGKIQYISGKQDMIAKGVFDDINLAIACHSMGGVQERVAEVNGSLNGFLSKRVEYLGQAAHAGANPHMGVNALQAANIGMMALNAQRETFQEADSIRVHGIITEGGQTVNTIPERLVLEYYVRGATLPAIQDANAKVNRSFEAGAHAMGASVVIEDTPGYMPLVPCRDLSDVIKGNLIRHLGEGNVTDSPHSFASGDIGDVAMILPATQFNFGGFTGSIHGKDFEIADEEMAYIIPAKALAATIFDLAQNGGELARIIIQNNPPHMIKQSYLEQWLDSPTKE